MAQRSQTVVAVVGAAHVAGIRARFLEYTIGTHTEGKTNQELPLQTRAEKVGNGLTLKPTWYTWRTQVAFCTC
jgi:pheromone shutdown protein TraB